MEGFFLVMMFVVLACVFIDKALTSLPTAKRVPCKLHKWHPFDKEGWLPEDYKASPRYKESRLMCQVCLREPNAETSPTIMED